MSPLFAQAADDETGSVGNTFGFLLGALPGLLLYGFVLFMAVHAARARQWIWLVAMLAFPFCALWYFMNEYRNNPMRGFELPGAENRARAKRLEGELARAGFDRPDLRLSLGDVRFRQGKLTEAEAHLKIAREQLPKDTDAASLYGQVLLRTGRAADAIRHLKDALTLDARHNYGYTRMAYAEALAATGASTEAESQWRTVLNSNEYDRAKVQLAELLHAKNDRSGASTLLDEVIRSSKHATTFDRKRDRVWLRKAKSLRRRIGN